MSAKRYVGKKVVSSSDGTSRLHRSSVEEIANAALTQSQIDSQISSGLAQYASKAYVDQQDALRATVSYVNQQDALRVRLAERQAAGGVVALQSNGKVSTAQLKSADLTYQRSPRQYFGTAAYITSSRTFSSTETAILTISIADPGFAYRVLVWGTFESAIDNTSSYTYVVARIGSTAGTIIARGYGAWRNGVSHLTITPDNSVDQAARTGATTIYIRALRSGSGTGTITSFNQNVAAMVIPA